jgi:drug/metabolite transporter (DMT)-like permease
MFCNSDNLFIFEPESHKLQHFFAEYDCNIFSALFFAYISNVSSLKSIELAPNPGYSLVISKSYVVFTTLFSFLFLGGEISPKKILAISLIIIFSSLIAIDPAKTKIIKSNNWLAYTMYSFFGWGFLSLTIKYLSVQGIPTLTTLTIIPFCLLPLLLENLQKFSLVMTKNTIFYFIAIGVFSSIFNYFTLIQLVLSQRGLCNAKCFQYFGCYNSSHLIKTIFHQENLWGCWGHCRTLLLIL